MGGRTNTFLFRFTPVSGGVKRRLLVVELNPLRGAPNLCRLPGGDCTPTYQSLTGSQKAQTHSGERRPDPGSGEPHPKSRKPLPRTGGTYARRLHQPARRGKPGPKSALKTKPWLKRKDPATWYKRINLLEGLHSSPKTPGN